MRQLLGSWCGVTLYQVHLRFSWLLLLLSDLDLLFLCRDYPLDVWGQER